MPASKTRGQMLIELMQMMGKISKMRGDATHKIVAEKKKLARISKAYLAIVKKEKTKTMHATISRSTLRRWARAANWE